MRYVRAPSSSCGPPRVTAFCLSSVRMLPHRSFRPAGLTPHALRRESQNAHSVQIYDRAQHDAALIRTVVASAAVHRGPLVPHQHIADAPAVVIDKELLGGVVGDLSDMWLGLLPLNAVAAMRVQW